MITPQQLSDALKMPLDRAIVWAAPLNDAMDKRQITTPLRVAAFLSQMGYESELFSRMEENLNYSAARLVEVFPSHFDMPTAIAYAHQPEKIANRVYAGRYGNGSESSGDGWLYRGRGLPQLTFKDNYADCGSALGLPLCVHPELLLEPVHSAASGAWFWAKHGLNELADKRAISTITKIINGGYNGLADRLALYRQVLLSLKE